MLPRRLRSNEAVSVSQGSASLRQAYAALSRGVAVLRGRTLVVNLPGNPRAVEEGMAVLLPLLSHIGQLLAGPLEHRGDVDTGHRPSGPA